MRTKIVAAIALGVSVLGFQAAALAAQHVATHHRAAATNQPVANTNRQIDPRYYDESAGQGYTPYANQRSQGSFAVGGFH
jgi:hypothetical protein